MKNIDKKHAVILPEEVVDDFEIKDNDNITLIVDEQKIIVNLTKDNSKSILLSWFLYPTIIVSIIFFLYFYLNNTSQIELTGDSSIATATIFLGLFSGMISFTYFFIKERKNKKNTPTKDIYWRNFPTVVLSFAIIELFALTAFFKILDQLFLGISFDIYTSTFLFFIFVSIVNYSLIYMALSVTPSLLTNVLFFVIIGGVFAAMITNSNQQWWTHNFSFLGTSEANSSWRFNVTLIISGLLMIALIDYLFVILQRNIETAKRLAILRILLILTAICLALVGIFPYNDIPFYQQMHNRVAGYLVYLIIIIILGLRWLLPEISKDFIKLSYIILAALVFTVFLFLGIGYLSLTAFELIAFILAFSWLLLLMNNLQQLAYKSLKSFETTIKLVD